MMVQLRRLLTFRDTVAGRLVPVLTLGLAAASIISLLVAEHGRLQDFNRFRLDRVVDSAADIVARFARDPTGTQATMDADRILGARPAPPDWPPMRPDPLLDRLLAARLGSNIQAQGMAMSQAQCFPNFSLSQRAAGVADTTLPECWFVEFQDSSGVERRLSIDLMPFRVAPSPTLEPASLVFIVLICTLLSLAVARFAAAPLRRLTQAAQSFSVTLDPEPISEEGPREVRAALHTFNLMQQRVREGFRERTQILASVTHDLQTPLTRLRLRLEQVEDEALRARLIADLAATQKLVKDGIELARSSESREPWSIADIDSILSSIAEDAAEFGSDVRFVSGCGAQVRVKPDALIRCLTNLVDNAIKYGGGAELSCTRAGTDIQICVRDHGPGLPGEALERVFEPFQRNERYNPQAPNGSGLGLTIARAQAQTFGAVLSLVNHSDGGLVAILAIRAC